MAVMTVDNITILIDYLMMLGFNELKADIVFRRCFIHIVAQH